MGDGLFPLPTLNRSNACALWRVVCARADSRCREYQVVFCSFRSCHLHYISIMQVSEKYGKAVHAEKLRRSTLQQAIRALELRGAHNEALGVEQGARDAFDLASVVGAALHVQRALQDDPQHTPLAQEGVTVSKNPLASGGAPSPRPSLCSNARRRLTSCDLSLGWLWRGAYRACASAPSIVPRAVKPLLKEVVGSTLFEFLSLALILANTVRLDFCKGAKANNFYELSPCRSC